MIGDSPGRRCAAAFVMRMKSGCKRVLWPLSNDKMKLDWDKVITGLWEPIREVVFPCIAALGRAAFTEQLSFGAGGLVGRAIELRFVKRA